MAEIEIGPLADRLADDELAELLKKLEKVGAPAMSAEDDGEATTIAVVDGAVLTEFLDRLDAYDLACDIYLPFEFDGRVEVADYRIGSAASLIEVLEEMKDDLALEDDEDDEDEDEDDDGDDEDDDGDDADYAAMKLIEAKVRGLWKVIYDGAKTSLDRKLPLHVKAD